MNTNNNKEIHRRHSRNSTLSLRSRYRQAISGIFTTKRLPIENFGSDIRNNKFQSGFRFTIGALAALATVGLIAVAVDPITTFTRGTAAKNWKELGMEYIAKGIGETEKVLSYNNSIEFGEEPQKELSSTKTNHDLSLKALESENAKLREEIATLRTSVETLRARSLLTARLEERLKAIETLQMAKK